MGGMLLLFLPVVVLLTWRSPVRMLRVLRIAGRSAGMLGILMGWSLRFAFSVDTTALGHRASFLHGSNGIAPCLIIGEQFQTPALDPHDGLAGVHGPLRAGGGEEQMAVIGALGEVLERRVEIATRDRNIVEPPAIELLDTAPNVVEKPRIKP